MTNDESPQQTATLSIEQSLQQAIALQRAGQLQEAGELYQTILQVEPNHPEANHNMGVLAVQMKQPAAGLPYFTAALDADPARGQYWLNYIDALFQAGQLEDARQVLALAQQQGLEGDEVEALAAHLNGDAQVTERPDTEHQHAAKKSLPNQKTSQPKKSARHKGGVPSSQEINTLVNLFTAGRLTEAANLAQAMTVRFPLHEFGWKALGAVYKQMGRSVDALLPMQKAAALSPGDVEAHYNLGVTLQELGRLDEAEASYRRALRINQNYAEAHSNLGVILQELGRLNEAEASCRRALQINPNHAKAHSNLGAILQKLGRLDEAEASLRRALQVNPNNAETHSNLGNTLKYLGRLDEAEASYRQALQINPDYADVHYNLGNILQELGRRDEAEASYRKALSIKPDYAEAYFNLGNILQELGRPDEAEASYRKALSIKPDYAEAHFNLGNILLGKVRLAEAEANYKRALEINPDYAEADYNLGICLWRQCKLTEAAIYYWRALKLKPDYAEVYCSLTEVLVEWGRLDEAEESLQRALKIKPDFALAHAMLGSILTKMGRLAEAQASCQRALDIDPDDFVALCNLGNALQDHGQLDKAEASYRQALEHQPTNSVAHSNLLFCILHNPTTDAEASFAEHCRFGDQFEPPLRANWVEHTNSRDPERCLQVGFVSGDLGNHAVANFIEPVLTHLARRPQLSLHAYATHIIDDRYSKRLHGYFAHWHTITSLTEEVLAEKIRADGIDILIDLSGHTGKNRLLTFARKPAPVQASWMGYPGTTGLSAMDYYLADRFLLPPGQFDGQFTEKIVRLPANAPFLPFEGAPPVNTLPALSNGYVTFGSFNRLSKLSRSVIALWAQLLRALPDSRMLLAGMPQDGKYDALIEWFSQEGIARERLSFHARSDMVRYLTLHQQVDICLDTFPYNGGTTTCHALWMGVPTLTLTGDTLPGRVGIGILGHFDLESFAAHDAADFVQKGLCWAGNLAALSDIRAGLRERFAHSAIGQPAVIAAGLERALRIMWQRWCAGLPTESFEVSLQEAQNMMREDNK